MSSLYFDRQDHELLDMIGAFLAKDSANPLYQRLFDASLHPNGIKVLAVSREFRIAYAVVNLLDSLEAGKVQDRLSALTALRDEVLYSAQTGFRRNTGRVLIQIMKELVRGMSGPQDRTSQLELAHSFRMAATGKPRVVRRMLKRYHLLEMPEAWNQLAFDHHVHDANTKGRKNPTHLIMDAWVKGLRTLTVVYYNYIEPPAARELLEAARIMDMTVRIGVEYQLRFRDRFVELICIPGNMTDTEHMLTLLDDLPIQHLMREGRKVSLYRQEHILMLFERYNETHRAAIGAAYGLELPATTAEDFLNFVGAGQTSLLHLGEYVYKLMLPRLEARAAALQAEYADAGPERRQAVDEAIEAMNRLDADILLNNWLSYEANPDLPDPMRTSDNPTDDPSLPEFMRIRVPQFLELLAGTRRNFMTVLNLAMLSAGDVLELLWDCEGGITHLELFNLKEWHESKAPHLAAINELQLAINNGSAPELKRIIRGLLLEYARPEHGDAADNHCPSPDGSPSSCEPEDRHEKFRNILLNIPKLQGFYKTRPLQSRIGSDSTSRAARGTHGMGMVYPLSLPQRAQRAFGPGGDELQAMLPLRAEIVLRESHMDRKYSSIPAGLSRLIRRLPGLGQFGRWHEREWLARTETIRLVHSGAGNIASMGGVVPFTTRFFASPRKEKETWPGFNCLNSSLANFLKVFIGFVIAMTVFQHTQSWWVLAWLGAPIWFAITGVRNILQAVLGGGGIKGAPLLRWNDYVSWSRLCDSLMYTGISVLLLELIIRKWLLNDLCSLNVQDSPLTVFTIIAVANAIYICGHNIYRGLPREAVIGNALRSVIAIPLAMLYNEVFTDALLLLGVVSAPALMQQGAAIVSKMASDTVAAYIEGFADRANNIRNRRWDYDGKLKQLFSSIARLELLFPEEDVMEKLRRPQPFAASLPGGPESAIANPPDDREKAMEQAVESRARELESTLIINALDLLYFWMYQPRAREVLRRLVNTMSTDERAVFLEAQQVLRREREVSGLFVEGLVGHNFSRPLSFYLECHKEYLGDMARLAEK